MMKIPEIDNEKKQEVMDIIDTAATLFEESDYENDETVKNDLKQLDFRLKEITGKEDISVDNYHSYWSYTSLETVAKEALMPKPEKQGLSDKRITEIIKNIFEYNQIEDEAELDYWMNVLEIETGLNNITDYIFYPDLVGLELHASLDEIIAKILIDKTKSYIELPDRQDG
ncbi:MAG: hypothetical protein HDT39_16950 [Lachnospiraceae bacterium]|nr:hypothetical protein [Lachnospiraceae bacterium]